MIFGHLHPLRVSVCSDSSVSDSDTGPRQCFCQAGWDAKNLVVEYNWKKKGSSFCRGYFLSSADDFNYYYFRPELPRLGTTSDPKLSRLLDSILSIIIFYWPSNKSLIRSIN